jgi:TrmH family RNA methyltransferase
VRGALVAPQLAEAPRGATLLETMRQRGVDIVELGPLEFASAADTESPQGVLALAEIPQTPLDSLTLPARARIVVLDAVQDPGNVGTIVRTAAALGATAVVALPGTVDLWNAKVVRSAMGASFHIPVVAAGWEAFDQFRRRDNVAVWGADAGGEPLVSLPAPPRIALLMGNEGAGLSSEARSRVELLVSLPIAANVESLNVAVATGILLYQLRA